ncbi:MAG: sulfatase-like hydrolase/transferase [Bacteroidales bacterium]
MKNVNIGFFLAIISPMSFGQKADLPPPNILWISWEDVGPHFGAYGDDYAVTPNIDMLANKGLTYLNAYSNYPVCAPARTTVITGQYASSYGGQHMMCRSIPDENVQPFPVLLREAGYYCSNDRKDHYQMGYDQDIIWDRMGAFWNPEDYGSLWEGKLPEQPFFTVVNLTTTHEGRTNPSNTEWVNYLKDILGTKSHDPEKATVPPYFPDTKTTRESIALYYDNITYADSISGIILKQLEESGMDENTIVVFWGDHGWGLPRGKRWLYQSGLQVPVIVRIPEKYKNVAGVKGRKDLKPGAKTDELISFVDFAPTMLSLAGIKIPEYMQGQAFLGSQSPEAREYVYGGRERMDETYDNIRAVMDKDYLYIRNFMWHLPYTQNLRTMDRDAIMEELRELHDKNQLNEAQKPFFSFHKPVEELYDFKNDPHQLNNLAAEPEYFEVLKRFRNENINWMLEIRDIGLITEPELDMIKWPDGLWPKTTPPVFTWTGRNYWNGGQEIKIDCPTPGAKIAWKTKNSNNWNLYTKPVVIGEGETIQAKANRPGFYTSPVEEFWPGKPVKTTTELQHYKPWQKEIDDDLLERLIVIKNLDFKGKAALNDYYNYLTSDISSIRYWAVVGIRTLSKTKQEKEKARQKFTGLISDPSPIVRIEAAFGLCELGDFDTGIPVLKAALKHEQESVRLYALNHLDKMGEKAKLAFPLPEIPEGTANNYSNRVIIRIYKRLGITPEDMDNITARQRQDIQRIYDSVILNESWDYGFEDK